MSSGADSLSAVENDYSVRVADGADSLGNDYFCRFGKLFCKSFAQSRVGAVVESGERVVRDQYLRLSCKCAAIERRCFCPPETFLPSWAISWSAPPSSLETNSSDCDSERAEERVFAAVFRCAFAEKDVVLHRAGEKHRPLRHIAYSVVKCIEGIVLHVHAVYQNLSGGRVIEPGDEADKRCFAASGRADYRKSLPLSDVKGYIGKLVLAGAGVSEGDVSE